MIRYLIVGGGTAGLLVGKFLKECNASFQGLEKTEKLGGIWADLPCRIYDRRTVEGIAKGLGQVEWELVEEAPVQRVSGEWQALNWEYEEYEKNYLGEKFYEPKGGLSSTLKSLSAELAPSFLTRKQAVQVLGEQKRVICQDGSEYVYDRLIWCCSLENLGRIWEGDKTGLNRVLKGSRGLPGILDLMMRLKGELGVPKNTAVFPFRYKEKKLRAFRVAERGVEAETLVHWLVFLETEIIEDREEVAKCLRALKRELQKEFPELKDQVRSEKIFYLPAITNPKSVSVKSLEILPGLVYVGPQVRVEESDEAFQSVERTMANVLRFQESFHP